MAHLAGDVDVIIGVGTHLDSHTAAACSAAGRQLARAQIPATPAGYARLLGWAGAAAGGGQVAWAIEGTRSYGAGLARYLAAGGEQVTEIDGSHHLGKRRAGKSDAIDAVRAARELPARPHAAQMRAGGDREALRLLLIGRDHAVGAAKTARAALASILVTAPAPLREQLRHLPARRRPAACAAWQCPPGADRLTRTTCQVLASLGQRITALTADAADAEAQIAGIVENMAPAWSPPSPASAR
jgi:transposase